MGDAHHEWEISLSRAKAPFLRAGTSNGLAFVAVIAVVVGFNNGVILFGSPVAGWIGATLVGGIVVAYYLCLITSVRVANDGLVIVYPAATVEIPRDAIVVVKMNVINMFRIVWVVIKRNGARPVCGIGSAVSAGQSPREWSEAVAEQLGRRGVAVQVEGGN